MYKNYLKYTIDFILALSLLLLLSPLFIVVCILLLMANKGYVFFIQMRPGKDEMPFYIIKFKTMNDRKDEAGNLCSDEVRLTVVGKWVRKLSLDEIPQLLNVIKGEMSLVGPRPLLMEYLPLYSAEQKKRHNVRPGITGWAQVNGRNAINWQTKFSLDLWYVSHYSFLIDFKILLMTAINVIKSKDISQKGEATVRFFEGNV